MSWETEQDEGVDENGEDYIDHEYDDDGDPCPE